MKNILIATDLTANNAHALDRAILIAHTSGAKLHILHVASAFQHPAMKEEAESSKKKNEDKIQVLVSGNSLAENLAVSIHIASGGRVHERIIEHTEKLSADLIIIGMHEKIEYISSVVSTTLERVIFTGNHPVLLVAAEAKQPYQNVLLGPNLSIAPEATIRLLVKFCGEIHLTLLLNDNNATNAATGRLGRFIYKLKKNRLAQKRQKFIDSTEKALQQSQQTGHALSPTYTKTVSADTVREEAQKAKTDLIALDMCGRIAPRHLKVEGLVGKLIASPPCDILIMQ